MGRAFLTKDSVVSTKRIWLFVEDWPLFELDSNGE